MIKTEIPPWPWVILAYITSFSSHVICTVHSQWWTSALDQQKDCQLNLS